MTQAERKRQRKLRAIVAEMERFVTAPLPQVADPDMRERMVGARESTEHWLRMLRPLLEEPTCKRQI